MRIETTGMVLTGTCDVRTELCRARVSAPLTAVRTPRGKRVHVCRPCLEDMVREGQWEIPGARVAPRHDVAVLDRHGHPRLLIDARSPAASVDAEEWARRVHRNLVLHSGMPLRTTYLLVGFPDLFFGWGPGVARDPDGAPTHQSRDTGVLAPFRSRLPLDPESTARERIVAAWVESFLAEPARTAGGAGRMAHGLRPAGRPSRRLHRASSRRRLIPIGIARRTRERSRAAPLPRPASAGRPYWPDEAPPR